MQRRAKFSPNLALIPQRRQTWQALHNAAVISEIAAGSRIVGRSH
jgi:hypothetical protein